MSFFKSIKQRHYLACKWLLISIPGFYELITYHRVDKLLLHLSVYEKVNLGAICRGNLFETHEF